MASTIKLKNSVTTTGVPISLSQGEVAINITDKKVWVGNASSSPIQIVGNGATNGAGGANTQVQFNSSGALAGSANMTFNGDFLTISRAANSLADFLFIRNTDAGSSAYTRANIGNDASLYNATLTLNSSTNTSGAGVNGFSIYAETGSLALGAGGAQAIFVQSSNQNIGIGNSLPLRMVDITRSSNGGSATEFPSLAVRNTLATLGNATTTFNIARLDVQSGNGTVFGDVGTLYDAGYAGMFIGTESNHPVRLQTAGTERIRITNTGNVGIGTANPLQKLEINGVDVTFRINDTNGSVSDFNSDSTGLVLRNFLSTFRFTDSVGIVKFKVDASGNLQFNSGYGAAATAYGCRAWVNFNGTSSNNLSGTYTQTGTTVTVSMTAHGYASGASAYLDFTTGAADDGVYVVSVVDANTFTVTQASRSTFGDVTSIRSTIRGSGNVSSVSDNALGDYTVNFINEMPDVNYSVAGSGFRSSFGSVRTMTVNPAAYAVDYVQIYTAQTDSASGSLYDFEFVNVNIFR